MDDFSFVILTDSHVSTGADDGYWWNRMLVTRAREILTLGVADANALKPDFVAHCGDLTGDSRPESFRAAADILAGLDCPLYFAPGNHDTYIEGSRDLAAEVLGFPEPPLYRAVRTHGWRLILIDSAYWAYKDGTIHDYFDPEQYVDSDLPDRELAWLEQELADDPDTPSMCFTHVVMAVRPNYPVSRLPGGKPVSAPTSDLSGFLCRNGQLKTLLARHPCIKAVFTGHGHFHDCVVEHGCLYCQTAALVSYPNEIRQVRVHADRIEVEALPLSGGGFPELSYVAAGGNRWTAGRPEDRSGVHRL